MDISYIDNLAHNTESIMHRASALSKVTMVALVVASVVVGASPIGLGLSLLLLILTIAVSRLPVIRVALFSGYAFFFSLIFALSQVGGGLSAKLVIVLKAVTAATALILLITTTPYPQIFGVLQAFLPAVLVDIMLVTYRSFFILLDQISNRLTAMRIRGGYSPLKIVKNLSNVGRILGGGIIHAWELSENMHDAMYVRGYSGRLPVGSSWRVIRAEDVLPLAVGLIILVMAVF